VVAGLALEPGRFLRPQHRPHAGRRERAGEVDAKGYGVRVRAPHEDRLQHPRELDVLRVLGLPARPLGAVGPRRGAADGRERSLRPPVESVLLDDEPRLLDAALDLALSLQ
jgi:hypothetical protein